MNKKSVLSFLKYASVFIWLSILTETDSYYSVYLLIAIISIVAITKNYNTKSRIPRLDYAISISLSLVTTLANYQIFTQQVELYGTHVILVLGLAAITFTCGLVVFYNILPFVNKIIINTTKEMAHSPQKTFLICFSIFVIIDILVLFICCYPGSLTADSIDEVGQILSNNYSNHHPFYYTILMWPFISIGTNLFHDINIGIALFNVLQIIILSTAFAYSISTLQRIGIPKKILKIVFALLLLLPYNLIFSFTIWKDVLFGAFFLIFIVTLYRYFNAIRPYKQSKYLQSTLILISGVAICLFRSNALIAIIVSTIFFFILFRKRYFKLGLLLIFIVTISFILKRPVLQYLNIKQADTIESLSIPAQQITRTLKYEKALVSEEDLSLINKIANHQDLIDAYSPITSDPVKNTIRMHKTQHYIKENAIDYSLLYIRLGLQHPIQYSTAWIDQTKGYWNGGYNYWIWSNKIETNDYGIERKNSNFLAKVFDTYLESFQRIPFLQPIVSIGLAVWLVFLLLYRNILSKNKKNLFLFAPLITTWMTILIATPVFCEFRYIYFIFTTTPFLAIVTFAKTPRIALKAKKGAS